MTSMRVWLISLSLVALVSSAVAAGAQSESDIDLIAGWSSRQKLARDLTIDGKVAKLFGLSAGADVECFGVGFDNHQGTKVFFCPITNRPERLFVRKELDTDLTYYLTKNGDLDKTVFLDTSGKYMEKKKDKAYLMNNDTYREGYEVLLNFFLERAKAGTD